MIILDWTTSECDPTREVEPCGIFAIDHDKDAGFHLRMYLPGARHDPGLADLGWFETWDEAADVAQAVYNMFLDQAPKGRNV